MTEKGKNPKKKSKPQALLVKAGLHTEMQKFGDKPDPKSPPWFDTLQKEVQKNVIKYEINVVGIDYTDAQNKALFAIQKLLSQTNYKGNLSGSQLDGNNSFKFHGYLPSLRFTPTQYLEAFGVTKFKTGREKYEYSFAERKEALKALVDLADKRNLIIYKRIYWIRNKKGRREQRIDRIETVQPLISITRGWEALTKYQDALLDKGKSTKKTDEKLKEIAIEPCPILVDQINSYFILKPANYREEIYLKSRELGIWKVSKYTYLFIDFLMAQAELKRRKNEPLIITVSMEELAYKLRMDTYIKKRMWNYIRGCLNNSYKLAQKLGYLLGYKTVPGKSVPEVEVLTLNPEKFAKALAIQEARKSMDQ